MQFSESTVHRLGGTSTLCAIGFASVTSIRGELRMYETIQNRVFVVMADPNRRPHEVAEHLRNVELTSADLPSCQEV